VNAVISGVDDLKSVDDFSISVVEMGRRVDLLIGVPFSPVVTPVDIDIIVDSNPVDP
jgi:hypothetical protein